MTYLRKDAYLQLQGFFVYLPLLLALALFSNCQGGEDIFSDIGISGGTGDQGYSATTTITAVTPTAQTFRVKNTATASFTATGDGEPPYVWTWEVDNTVIQTGSDSTFDFVGSSYALGSHSVKVTLVSQNGTANYTWSVFNNGTPSISAYSPPGYTENLAQNYKLTSGFGTLSLSVTASDPNATDTLYYDWTIDGSAAVASCSAGATKCLEAASATADDAELETDGSEHGTYTVQVVVRDGDLTDTGTFSVSQSWKVHVNHFNMGCNDMDNDDLDNRSCIVGGVESIGDGENPLVNPTRFRIRGGGIALNGTDGIFFTSATQGLIWYWNRSGATATIFGTSVGNNEMKVVAGVGNAFMVGGYAATTATQYDYAWRAHFQAPRTLAYDGSHLYVADTVGNTTARVRRISVATGLVENVLGGGAGSTNGTAGSAWNCNSVEGLAVFGGYLYSSCSAVHRVVRTDLASPTFVSSTFAGNGGGTSTTASENTAPTGIAIGTPYGLAVDTAKSLLFIADSNGHRVRAVNLSGVAQTVYTGGVQLTINAGMQRTIVGNTAENRTGTLNAVTPYTSTVGAGNGMLNVPRGLSYDQTRGLLAITENSGHKIRVANLTGSNQSVGTLAATANQIKTAIATGTAGYIESVPQLNARVNLPLAVAWDTSNNDLIFSDWSNLRIRYLVHSTGYVELFAGNGLDRIGTLGNGSNPAYNTAEPYLLSERLSGPRHLAYDSVNKLLFVSDTTNCRIRVVDQYGTYSQAVGTGTCQAPVDEDEFPTLVSLNAPRQIALFGQTASFGGHLLIADYSNYAVRVWNRSNASLNIFGVTIAAGRVRTVAGTPGVQLTPATGGQSGADATLIALNNPAGVASDGTNLYIADAHCIKRVSSTGALTVIAGNCGVAGNTDGATSSTGAACTAVTRNCLNAPEGLAYYSGGLGTGLFIANTNNTNIRYFRLSGSGAIASQSIATNNMGTVACGGAAWENEVVGTSATCVGTNGGYALTGGQSGLYSVAVIGGSFCFPIYSQDQVRCVLIQGGLIETIVGPVQGYEPSTSTLGYIFGGNPKGFSDQSNVAAILTTNGGAYDYAADWAATGERPSDLTLLNTPIGITQGGNTGEVYVSDWTTSVVRRVKLNAPL